MYKHHSLGDYLDAIIRFGATPSLSSHTVCVHMFLESVDSGHKSICRVKVIIGTPSNCIRGPTNVTMQSKLENIVCKRKSCTTSVRRYIKYTMALKENCYHLPVLINIIKWLKVVEM
jgi:hypothetical protein